MRRVMVVLDLHVFVRATDPAGIPEGIQSSCPDADNSDTVMVTITVTDVDEVPVIAGAAAVSFNETEATSTWRLAESPTRRPTRT